MKEARLTELLVRSGLCASLKDARRYLKQGAVCLNERPISDDLRVGGSRALLRVGRTRIALVMIDRPCSKKVRPSRTSR